MRSLSAVLLVLSSCHPTPEPSVTMTAKPAVCPASFASGKGECGALIDCLFPEGTCWCTTGSYCGGTRPSNEIEESNRRLRWVCIETPPAVRGDGCPGTMPSGACDSKTKTECLYEQGCCFVITRCVEGQWKAGDHQCPP